MSCEIHQTVWTRPELEGEPDEDAVLIGTVQVRMNEIEFVLRSGEVLYRASLEAWALSQIVYLNGRAAIHGLNSKG